MISDEEVKQCNSMIPLLCHSKVFEVVFDGLENILAKMLSDIMEFDYEELKDRIILKRKSKDCLKLKTGEKKFVVSLDNNCLITLEFYNRNKEIMLLYLNFSDNYEKNSNLLRPLVKICFKNGLAKNNLENNLLIGSLSTVWCEMIYQNEKKEEIPNLILWGALFNCNDILKISKIIKGLMNSEEQVLFMKHLEKLV